MFPLSFSSSSSLSSSPPSLDSISELDRGLSDISEDEDTDTAQTPWTFPSNLLSRSSDQQLADPGRPSQSPSSSHPVATSETCSSELLRLEEGCESKTRTAAGIADWRSAFSLKAVAKCVSFILCFFSSLGKNGGRYLPTELISGFPKKLSGVTSTVRRPLAKVKMTSTPGPKYIISNMAMSKLHLILNRSILKLNRILSFLTQYLPPKFRNVAAAILSHPKQLRLPHACPPPISSYVSLSSPRSSVTPNNSPVAFYRSKLAKSVHHYLQNPSPLFLPCLLVLFLLAVMLTASQSLVLALILATPLGLTLCYFENAVSSQRRAVLPVFISDRPENQSNSAFNKEVSPLTPPRIRHQSDATWMQEMCDPAA